MHDSNDAFAADHLRCTRRYFLSVGASLAAISNVFSDERGSSKELQEVVAKLEAYFTVPGDFQDVSRGKPVPHSLPAEKKKEVGLTRETWSMDIIADPDKPATLGKTFAKKEGTAFTFADLMKMSEKHAVRFPKVMTCLNIGCPLGMGVWEGVPLRDVLWLTQPKENWRRVQYYGYHNDDPKQMFRSTLPTGRVLEDPHDWPPVILCYKLNGEWLDSQRGGPVRIVVPEAYGFKSVKWITHVLLSNLAHANDTYAEQNNDVDSPLKTFAATLLVPKEHPASKALPITGYAQVGQGGLKKVQVWIQPKNKPWAADDPHFTKAPWIDATILPPPIAWGGKLPDGKIPANTMNFDAKGQPLTWPMRFSKVHWATLQPALAAGEYHLRCRTIDAQGHAQPMPRPFRKSGHAAIETVNLKVV